MEVMREDMDKIVAASEWKGYWEILINENTALRDRVARLEEALKRGVELHENCDADTCMCGEIMWHPLHDHKPTSMLQYYGDQWAEEARRALEEK
jgi:hypothetical protein